MTILSYIILFFPYLIITLASAQNTALNFDGSDDQISISYNSSLEVSDQVTIEAWVKPSHTDWQTIWMKGNYGYGLALTGSNTSCQSSLKLAFWDQSACTSAILSTNTYKNNEWNHIAVTVIDNGSNLTVYFYIDGVKDGPHTSSQTAISNGGGSSAAYISRQGVGCNCNYMTGKIDELRVWNDVRTQAEIKANMNTELSGTENNLVAYYNFNNGTGTTVNDLTTNSNDGTMTNMASDDWVSNSLFAQNYALDLDGSNDYLQITDDDALDISSSITISAWIYPTNIANKDGIISKRTSTENSGDWAFRFTSSAKLKLLIWDGDANNGSTSSTNAISLNTWTHISFTHDNSTNTTKFYINGSLDATGTGLSKNLAGNNSNVYIGWDGQQGDKFFTGKIDEVRIWDDVRTQVEIQDYMYKELFGDESNLVAYYNFNNGRGTSIFDLTANDNNGTMINMDASSDWAKSKILGASITGNSGFRMLSSPVSGQILGSLLNNLWTQGMTGADFTNGTANVWTLNVSGQSWTALSDISSSGTSVAAGEGFLIYVFEDTDNDGSPNLPVTINVSGAENIGDATISSVPANAWILAGNPYFSPIDWDLIYADNNPFYGTAYVWDDATSAYKSWNGSTGGLTNGIIAPYQSFWVQNTFLPNQTLTISESHKAGQIGTLYRISDVQESGSITFNVSSSEFSDQTFMSFQSEGAAGFDNSDGYKLSPLKHSDRLVALSYADYKGLDINNLPYNHEGTISIPFDIMKLQIEEATYVTHEAEITFSWDVSNLPDHISLTLIDQITTIETDMDLVSSITFTTQSKGSFSASYSELVGTYPVVGEARFNLAVSYDALISTGNIKVLPTEFALHATYPNPFNPSTTISFDLAESGKKVSLSVYDLRGALVGTLMNESKVAGTYQYKWTPDSELSSGVYFFELKTKNETKHQKVTYIK